MQNLTRRNWLQAAGASGLAFTQFSGAFQPAFAREANTDSLPMQLYKSLSDEQRQKVCLPSDHPKRQFVSNWWYIHPDYRIPNTFNAEQQWFGISAANRTSTAIST